MRINPRIAFALTLAAISSALYSCDPKRYYEEYQGMQNLSWPVKDTVTFLVPKGEDQNVLSTLRVKYDEDYDYYNLYVRYLLKDSLGNILENELMNINLFDPKLGKPLGSGFGYNYTQIDTLPLEKLKKDMSYKIQFVQYMRSNDLDGIESVGIKLEKREN